MIEHAPKLFDEYSRHARVLPGLWAAAPVLIAAAVLLPRQPLMALLPIVLGCGFTVLLAGIVRNLGKDLERKLIRDWDGLPTTHILRHREAGNRAIFNRRRKALERLYGEPLPTPRQEATNPAGADEVYVAATRRLIDQVRARQEEFPLVQHENIAYGRARNMLALRPYAIGLLGLMGVIDYYAWSQKGATAGWWVVVVGHLALLGCWLVFVREAWVRQAANTYAERLFEALDRMVAPDRAKAGTDST
jgi:hypothetical protein